VRRLFAACQARAPCLDIREGEPDNQNQSGCAGMPTLFRFLVVIGLIVGAVYGGMMALVMLVEPTPREMSVRIPSDKLQP
jgi:hypothetical protein